MMSSIDNKPDGNYVLELLCNLDEIYKGYPKTEIRCILDSGACVNLSKYATHLNTESRIMVAGFNGSTETPKHPGASMPFQFHLAATTSSTSHAALATQQQCMNVCMNVAGRHLLAPRNLPKAEQHITVPKGPIAQWEVCVA